MPAFPISAACGGLMPRCHDVQLMAGEEHRGRRRSRGGVEIRRRRQDLDDSRPASMPACERPCPVHRRDRLDRGAIGSRLRGTREGVYGDTRRRAKLATTRHEITVAAEIHPLLRTRRRPRRRRTDTGMSDRRLDHDRRRPISGPPRRPAIAGGPARPSPPPELGLVADRNGGVSLLAGPQLLPSKLPALTGRSIRGVALSGEHRAWLVGDGGLVLTSKSGASFRELPAGPLPDDLRQVSDFHAVAGRDTRLDCRQSRRRHLAQPRRRPTVDQASHRSHHADQQNPFRERRAGLRPSANSASSSSPITAAKRERQ